MGTSDWQGRRSHSLLSSSHVALFSPEFNACASEVLICRTILCSHLRLLKVARIRLEAARTSPAPRSGPPSTPTPRLHSLLLQLGSHTPDQTLCQANTPTASSPSSSSPGSVRPLAQPRHPRCHPDPVRAPPERNPATSRAVSGQRGVFLLVSELLPSPLSSSPPQPAPPTPPASCPHPLPFLRWKRQESPC